MEQLQRVDERMTPTEAEAVLKRFREEEELRQREMEAAATNPTVSDLAEGLGVSRERIAALLAQVRGAGEPVPFRGALTQAEATAQVQRSNRNAWIRGGGAGDVLLADGSRDRVHGGERTTRACP
jgi:hypothetical protein